ncbi:MAG TPA: BatA domain-containing protein, partial [Polyangia bacterium]
MSFLAPGYVLLTALFAVPIAIHLIGRSRAKVRRFAAIELLLRGDKRVARRTKIRQWLLLLLRALAIAAVPLILAKPFIEAASGDLPATAVGGAQSAVIVVDDSMSMSAERRGQPLVELARARARRIVEALGGESDAAVVLASRG